MYLQKDTVKRREERGKRDRNQNKEGKRKETKED